MQTEWLNTTQNVPHVFINDADTALRLAIVERPDGGGLWAMVDPLNPRSFPLQPYVQATPGVWPPQIPPRSEWTPDNVIVGTQTLREWFNNRLPEIIPQTVAPIVAAVATVVNATAATAPADTAASVQTVVDWIDGMAAAGSLYTDDLTTAVNTLSNISNPPPLVGQKLTDWRFILANGLIPDRPPTAGPSVIPPAVAAAASSAAGMSPQTLLGLGALALAALFLWRRA